MSLNSSANRQYAMLAYADKIATRNTSLLLSGAVINDSIDSEINKYKVISNTLGLVSANKIVLGFQRTNYEHNNIYNMYRYDIDNSIVYNSLNGNNKSYVVLTDEMKVYVCLYSTGKPSTHKPNHTEYKIIKHYPDGYVWLYVYTLSSEEIKNYLTDDFVPFNPTSNSIKTFKDKTSEHIKNGSIFKVYYVDENGQHRNDSAGQVISLRMFSNTGTKALFSVGMYNDINIIDGGEGYLINDKLVITDGNIENNSIRCCITPINGYGHNIIDLLCCNYVMVTVTLNKDSLNQPFNDMFIPSVALVSISSDNPTFYYSKLPVLSLDNLRIGDMIEVIDKLTNNIIDTHIVYKDNEYIYTCYLNISNDIDVYHVKSSSDKVLLTLDTDKTIEKHKDSEFTYNNILKSDVMFSMPAMMYSEGKTENIISFISEF